MTQPHFDQWMSTLLGDEAHQRRALRNTVSASAVYAVCGAIQWFWVWFGYAVHAHALALVGMLVFTQVMFYAAIRSGWSRRFDDPALTMAQMVCAILCLSAAYLINPPVRGALLMEVALVLVFGAFSLSPQRCRRLGWFALVVFGATMATGASIRPATFVPVIEIVTFIFAAATLPLIGHLSGQLSQMRRDLKRQRHELHEAMQRLNVLATRDELTGLPNRRYMHERIEHEIGRLDSARPGLCIGILDLDHFKTVNDQLGHAAGDVVLVTFARQAQTMLRATDILARWGGEEFLLACPNTSIEDAQQIVERVRAHLHQPQSWAGCEVTRVTFSAGLALHDPAEPFGQTLARADAALYEAKRQGRDRCVVG